MQSFMTEFSLKTILPDNTPTFHHNNQISESQIDHILFFIPDSNSDISLTFCEQLCQKDHDENLSSHDVIVAKLDLPIVLNVTNEKDYSSSYSDFHVKKPKWDEERIPKYQTQTAEIIGEMMSTFDQPFFIPALVEMFSRMLVVSAEHNFECSQPSNKKMKVLPTFSKELN